ncbi:MAG TPA: FtsX-like permease family protein [Planctomycetota bacterium]|nr:FtsX-like permease family protein [Planctomycetota bacterium]
MTLSRLLLKELLYRKLNLALGLLSVVVAVGCLVAELTVLGAHDARTEEIIRAREEETKQEMARLEDETRKIMKKLGFNVLILPKDQNLDDLYAKDYASKYMPEEYATRLAEAKVITMQHLLPSLRRKVEWPEQNGRVIILVGVRGQVPKLHRDPSELMFQPVPPRSMVVGYQLHKSLDLHAGDTVKLMGEDFTVAKLHEQRGDKDDITVWINLPEAQRLLKAAGLIPEERLINEIMALKCQCAGVGMEKVREELARILPETQAVELATRALARAEQRVAAGETARRAVEAERANRARLRDERERFAAWLVPIVALAATVWIGFLALSNVRERLPEIGILRALGLRAVDVFFLFLCKAILVGFVGALVGYLAGRAAGFAWSEAPVQAQGRMSFLDLGLFATVLAAAPALSALASWLPALRAAQQDPAVILRES